MGYLALDLSKTSTGFAVWSPGEDKPRYGRWRLGSEYTPDGQTFAALHGNMADLHSFCPFDTIFIETPISPAQLQGNTTIQIIRLLGGIAAHAHSFAHAYGCRIQEINVASWRADFVGRILTSDASARARRAKKDGDKRASARGELKALTVARCQQFGFNPRSDDEADAIGILTYGCEARGVAVPWRANEVLQAPLSIGARA